jgi:hypothetical protein
MLVLSGNVSAQGRNDQAFDRARQVQVRHTDKLMTQDGVVGTAVGLDESGRHAILVLQERPGVPGIPTDLEGVPVRPLVTGKIYARAKPAPAPTAHAPRDTTPPAAPSGLAAIAISSSQINLDWADNKDTDLSYYRVYRSTASGGPYTQIATNVRSSAYSSTGLSSGTVYYYVVTAVDTSGNGSGYSNEASAPTPMPALWCPRPVPIGVSTGHPKITAGTIGCRVIDAHGNVYALSNNHVYANENRAKIGDNVLQPGVYDGGVNPRDAIGALSAFATITFSRTASNTIDAAIAKVIIDEKNGLLLGKSTPLTTGYVTPSSTPRAPLTSADIGLGVQKYGRTTKLTTGTISAVNATVLVGYETGVVARFVGQIVITPGSFCAAGDSGSLIVTNDDACQPVGLLFAGSSTTTIANPIDVVLSYFGVTVDGQ